MSDQQSEAAIPLSCGEAWMEFFFDVVQVCGTTGTTVGGAIMTDTQNQAAADPRMETPGKSDQQWIADAVRNARPRKRARGTHPRWVAVMDVFGCGSGYAHALCNRFGFNPDEQVSA